MKLQPLVKHYHTGMSIEEVSALAEATFAGWAGTRNETRGQSGVALIARYMEMDAVDPGGVLIEAFHLARVRIGRHEVKSRRDLLFFGLHGHRLRAISWTKDVVLPEELPLLFAPAVLAANEDVGLFRISDFQFWHIRSARVLEVDIAAAEGRKRQIEELLNEAEDLVDAAG